MDSKQQSRLQRALPYIYGTSSSICFVIFQCFFKLLCLQFSSQYLVQARSTFLLIINTIFILKSSNYCKSNQKINEKSYFSVNIKDSNIFKVLLKKQIWTMMSVNLMLSSLRYVELSIANALINTIPIMLFFIEAYYYKKPLKKIQIYLTLFSFLGVCLIIKPLSGQLKQVNLFMLMPLIAAFGSSMSMIYTHELRTKCTQITILEYDYIFQLISSSLLMICIEQNQHFQSKENYSLFITLVMFLLIFTFAYSSHYLRIKSLMKRKPSEILPFNYVGIICALCIDFIFFTANIGLIQIIGVLLTSGGLLSQICINLVEKSQEYAVEKV